MKPSLQVRHIILLLFVCTLAFKVVTIFLLHEPIISQSVLGTEIFHNEKTVEPRETGNVETSTAKEFDRKDTKTSNSALVAQSESVNLDLLHVPDSIREGVSTGGAEKMNLEEASARAPSYQVVRVVDGDTVHIEMNGKVETVRLIGIDTPETVHPSKPVECMGKEASSFMKSLLEGTRVRVEPDHTQNVRDKYGRLLLYLFLLDGTNVNELLIEKGYAHEYTYDLPYRYQYEFRDAEERARLEKRGLWSGVCEHTLPSPQKQSNVSPSPIVNVTESKSGSIEGDSVCSIKGNITSDHDKIYHLKGCRSYEKTGIDESAGERWFCTEDEAVAAGWRKALNCS